MDKDVLVTKEKTPAHTLLIRLGHTSLPCIRLARRCRLRSSDGSRRVCRRRESGVAVVLGGSIPRSRGWRMRLLTKGLEALYVMPSMLL